MDINAEILNAAKRLVSLLEDPHPGLFTWCEFRGKVAKELRDKLNSVLEPDSASPENTTFI